MAFLLIIYIFINVSVHFFWITYVILNHIFFHLLLEQLEPVMYKLYGVLVHSGYSCNSGHYYCYVKGSNSMWYEMNDNRVS